MRRTWWARSVGTCRPCSLCAVISCSERHGSAANVLQKSTSPKERACWWATAGTRSHPQSQTIWSDGVTPSWTNNFLTNCSLRTANTSPHLYATEKQCVTRWVQLTLWIHQRSNADRHIMWSVHLSLCLLIREIEWEATHNKQVLLLDSGISDSKSLCSCLFDPDSRKNQKQRMWGGDQSVCRHCVERDFMTCDRHGKLLTWTIHIPLTHMSYLYLWICGVFPALTHLLHLLGWLTHLSEAYQSR